MHKISNIRNLELKKLKDSLFLRAVTILFWTTAPVIVAVVTFGIYTLSGHELTAEKAFTSLGLHSLY